jgi:hypothetical protein
MGAMASEIIVFQTLWSSVLSAVVCFELQIIHQAHSAA